MKRTISIFILVMLIITGCNKPQNEKTNLYFNATVLEVTEEYILVKPFAEEEELKSADKIAVSTNLISTHKIPHLEEGSRIRIVYNGEIAETSPAKIENVFTIYLLDETEPKKPSSLSTKTLRIVDGAETGNLVLAGSDANDIYTLNAAAASVYLDGKPADISALEDGMMAEISFNGQIQETYPARLGEVSSISVYSLGTEKNPSGTMYDLCGLYLQVLNDLWERDSGLNSDVTYISVDLSKATYSLTDGEKSAIAWIFASTHQAEALTLSHEELASQGYLTEVEIPNQPDDKVKLYEWKDGVLFSIANADEYAEVNYSLPTIRFNANKWRSPLGAYFFSDCEAVWPEKGTWSSYSIGAEMIS